jgi:putative alpha-1,2-mannosidase
VGAPRLNNLSATWMVPYDLRGLIGALGGVEAANVRLDDYFSQPGTWHGGPYFFIANGDPVDGAFIAAPDGPILRCYHSPDLPTSRAPARGEPWRFVPTTAAFLSRPVNESRGSCQLHFEARRL